MTTSDDDRSILFLPLEFYDPRIDGLIERGYQSDEKYRISKKESAERITFQLDLVRLEEPYRKRWKLTEDDHELYKEVIREGHSIAAYHQEEMVAVALAEVRKWNRTLWIWEFHVSPEYQRRGVGRQMMEAMEGKARSLELRTMLVETQSTNLPAIRFYQAVGFSVESVDLSYYTNHDAPDGEVAIFMKRKIL